VIVTGSGFPEPHSLTARVHFHIDVEWSSASHSTTPPHVHVSKYAHVCHTYSRAAQIYSEFQGMQCSGEL
jgi:hypothetical protein